MKTVYAIFIGLALSAASTVTAQPASVPAMATASPVERATADAVARLYTQVTAENVEGVAISTIIDRVGGKQLVVDGLARAEQIGGPRTIAEDVVQVSLAFTGERAADLLVRTVEIAPEKSPLDPKRMTRGLAIWSGRTFYATGSSLERTLRKNATSTAESNASTQAQPARLVLPETPPTWLHDAHTAAATADAAGSPLRTARAAEKAARASLREQLSKLHLDERTTLADAGSSAADAADDAVAAAKIAGVDYRADGSAEVSVSIDGQHLWRTLQLAADDK